MTEMIHAAFSPPTDRGDGKLSAGTVWTLTYRTFRQSPWPFIALGFLPVPFSVLAALPKLIVGREGAVAVTLSVLVTLAQYFVQFIGQIATVYGASRRLAGVSFTLGEALGVAVRRFLPLLAVGLMVGLVVILGFLLLVIPGLIAAVMLVLAVPACVIERSGPVASLNRSLYLTKGNRWRIVGALLLVVVLPLFGSFAVVGLAGAVAFGLQLQVAIILAVILGLLLLVPVILVLPAITMILTGVLFVELRRLKGEGGPRASISQVFD